MSHSENVNPKIIVDTNIFIHLKDVQDLPWKELFSQAKAIDIVVTSPVISELDDFKVGRNKRKRNRARLALNQIDKASQEHNMRLELRGKPLQINLVIDTQTSPDWSALPKLDPHKHDDQIVAAAIAFGTDAKIVSFDSGPRISARKIGLEAFTPPDTWLLQEEPDDRDEQMRALEKELAVAKARHPQITAGYETGENPKNNILLPIPKLQPLDNGLIDKLTQSFLEVFPRREIPVSPYSALGLLGQSINKTFFTEDDRATYNAAYTTFEGQVRAYFEQLHEHLKKVMRAQKVDYFIENDSPVVAKGLRIEYAVNSDFFLTQDEEDADDIVGSLAFPEAPLPPKLGSHLNHRLAGLDMLPQKRHRDPTKFYWQDRIKYGDQKGAVQCEEFRATERRNSAVWIVGHNGSDNEGEINLKISGSNLAKPISLTARLSMQDTEMKWTDERILKRLPDPLDEILRSFL